MSKNISKGLALELSCSKRVHSQGTPLLVDMNLLRKLGAGQVDLAIISECSGEKIIKIYEVKSRRAISFSQRKRLSKSAQVLSQILGFSAKIYLLSSLPK